jgi:type III secretory pathway component EscT
MDDGLIALRAVLSALAPVALAALRLTPAALALPLFGGRALPAVARVPVLAVLAFGAAPWIVNAPGTLPAPAALLGCALREVSLGIVLALVLGAPFFAIEHAGRWIDQTRGGPQGELSSLDGQSRTSPLSELLRWTWGATFVAAGGLRAVILAASSSFARWPPDPSTPAWSSTVGLEPALRWSAETIASGLALASAGLFALVAVEVTLGVASRVAPALASAGIAPSARALAGPALLAVLARALSDASLTLARGAIEAAGGPL